MRFKTHCFVYKQSKTGLFNYIVLHSSAFYDVNLTISPLDRSITSEFTKGISMKTSLINILCLQTIQITIIFYKLLNKQ